MPAFKMPPPRPTAPAVGDGQVVDAHRHAAADPEDPAGVVAADGQPVGARAVDPQVVRDAQLPARQGDGAVTSRGGEADQVGAGVGVGVEDRLPQRPGPLSARLPTVKVLGTVRSSSRSTLNRAAVTRFGAVCFLRAGRHEEGTCGSQPG